MAGNHGDEYEGEIALGRLIRRLDPARVRGTILPMANVPAVMAARRRSPLDNGNLNRAFPGSPGGTPTERLAHFLEHELFPRHDVVFDIHSGGTSMAHLPTALIENRWTRRAWTRRWRCWPAWAWTTPSSPPTGATRPPRWRPPPGAIGISGEFGGGGTLTPATLAATQRAIDQLLLALGVIDAPVLGPHAPADGGMQLLALDSHAQAIFATRRGWFEPAVDIGAQVSAGDLAGYYHDLNRLDAPEKPCVSGYRVSSYPGGCTRQRSRRLPDPGGAPGRAS